MKNRNFKIVVSFFCIWLTSLLSSEFQNISAFFLILSFGVLHGANDLLLLNKIKSTNNKSSTIRFLLGYVFVVLFTVMLFYFIPQIALFAFILLSSFHFGEQHWTEKFLKKTFIIKSFFFTYGFFILFMLFYFHQIEVTEIIFKITNFKIPKQLIQIPFFLSFVLLILEGIYLVVSNPNFKKNVIVELFYLLIFALIFKITGLMWGFAIYFIFWHSIPSMVDQVQYLYGIWNWNNFFKYCKSAFWFWLISVFGILLLYFLFKGEKRFEALFFAFLAAITVPHVWVIITMFGTEKESEK